MLSKKGTLRAERHRAKALRRKYYKSIRKRPGGEGGLHSPEQREQHGQPESVSVPHGAQSDGRVDLEEEDRRIGVSFNKRSHKRSGGTIALKRKKFEEREEERLKKKQEKEAEKSRRTEKRKNRNNIMRQSTKRGQPVMKGRIALLLDDIEVSFSQAHS